MYCVYLTKYEGKLLPKFYIGSTSIEKINSGKYFGSISSKKWKKIFKCELLNNSHLFSIEILSKHEFRTDALKEELNLQIKNDVVKSDQYINKSFAKTNGMFGRDVTGKNNPMFGKKRLDASIRMTGESNIAKRTDVKEKLKKAKIGYKPVPQLYSEETKLKMREVALNRSKEVKEKIREARKNSHSLEKARLALRIKTDKKYEWFISQLITELKNNNGFLEINEIYKIFSNKPIKYIKSAMIIMKKRELIHSIPKASKSLTVLNKT